MAVPSAPLRVLIGGGTGFLGQALRARLEKAGHSVRVISRSPSAQDDDSVVTWASIEHNGLPPCDALVQLRYTTTAPCPNATNAAQWLT